MSAEKSAAFVAAKAALTAFAATLTEEQRAALNPLVAKFVVESVKDYKAKRDKHDAAVKSARDVSLRIDPFGLGLEINSMFGRRVK